MAEMVRHHDERAVDLYLLVLAQASAGEFDVTFPAAVWVRALSLDNENGATAISKTLARLVAYKLVKRDRVRRRAHITLLCEDGSGEPYTHPGRAKDAYLQLPHAYWVQEWHRQLTLPAKAALLISLSLPRDFFLPIESARKQFSISSDTLGEGMRELRRYELLDQRTITKADPLTAAGYRTEYWYQLRPPFDQLSSSRSSHVKTSEKEQKDT
ncbi:MAG: hypothetical protein ACRDIE_23345 [Chloroflexota bacterium]